MTNVPDELPLLAKSEELALALRQIGLYEDRSAWISEGEEPRPDEPFAEHRKAMEGRHILIMNCLIGDHAFSKRVQNPEQVDVDAEFRAMMGGFEKQDHDDTLEKIEDRLKQGLNPFEED